MSKYDWKYEFDLKAWGGCTVARLIDADILITKIAYVAKHCARSDAQKALVGRIFYIIENMPTIAEEKDHDSDNADP